MPSQLALHRRAFLERLQSTVWGRRKGVPNNADVSNPRSVGVAEHLSEQLGLSLVERMDSANTLGKLFADAVADFLRNVLPLVAALRPGPFTVSTKTPADGIAQFAQYAHLRDIREMLEKHPSMRTTLGTDYLVRPDIVISRPRLSRESLGGALWSDDDRPAVGALASLIEREGSRPALFASVSAKWTIRSDRAQNTRTEALNMIRYRKGALPHVVAVTFEPIASRLASIAAGTGDVDCVYHGALPELVEATRHVDEASCDALMDLILGERLRDISDLPLDLAV